ncbi:hydroxyisourate hydrolase [Calidifontibacter sp. DB0510]|uniref:5-hydroxyisourate hydrolase n=1 Tax=Metallococcus carri TaxID=1656884 RepID=A0A967B2Y2_9MICO|nr:hydroxyisourate hydrolase [Metallococcus carri]NHN57052.1 hydroxyisourate hydrolase [Metallococcus carri]NOP39079.1 hydroxyisourate hydrolase [Calidifontibacter sp. DB2511S]
MGTLSTHILDTSRGRPAPGVTITLEDAAGSVVGQGVTDADGRVGTIGPEVLEAGDYRLRFAAKAYFDGLGVESFYPEVVVVFTIADPAQHYHVPVLLNPFGYSTYRGS